MNQRGVALIAGLVLLAALSLLALIATSAMILQRHMAANYHENKLALENSAIASSFATAWLYSRASHEREEACISDCVLPVAIHNAGEIPAQAEYQDSGWWQSNGIEKWASIRNQGNRWETIRDPVQFPRCGSWKNCILSG